jgi:hypothetical protein
VRRFIDYLKRARHLKRRDSSVGMQSPFLLAAGEFIAGDPEISQRLAQ